MQYNLKLRDGTTETLSFNLYFLNRFAQLTDMGLQNAISHLLGQEMDFEKKIVSGGVIGDLEVRAAVVAAGIQANGFANGELSEKTMVDGWAICEKVENSIGNSCWGSILALIIQCVIPDGLPADDTLKKKAAPKKRR